MCAVQCWRSTQRQDLQFSVELQCVLILWHILLDVSLDSVDDYSVAGPDLTPSTNLLLPPMRLCGQIGPMWCFVMTTELPLISVKVLQGQHGLELNTETDFTHKLSLLHFLPKAVY